MIKPRENNVLIVLDKSTIPNKRDSDLCITCYGNVLDIGTGVIRENSRLKIESLFDDMVEKGDRVIVEIFRSSIIVEYEKEKTDRKIVLVEKDSIKGKIV